MKLMGHSSAVVGVACAMVVGMETSPAWGGTIAHYRFESDLVTDASGNGKTLAVIRSPTLVPIPGSVVGLDLPSIVPQIGETNTQAVDFGPAVDVLQRLFAEPVVPDASDFTVQAFVRSQFTASFANTA